MKVLAIDPGPLESAFVVWDGVAILDKRKVTNHELLSMLGLSSRFPLIADVCVIEQVKSYGMAVSDSIFDTVFWTGRFFQAWDNQGYIDRIPRMTVKMHLCHMAKARDANIRQALIDRFEPGLKPKERPRGILKGLSSDMWAAFALAVTWLDQNEKPR